MEVGIDGRRGSGPELLWETVVLFEDGAVVAVEAEDRGAASVFFTLENIEETMAYEELSFSSSSEKGLNDVRLVTSSSLELLRDLVETVLAYGGFGEIGVGDSIEEDPGIKGRELRVQHEGHSKWTLS